MLEGLRAVGYLTTEGEEDTGPFFHLLRGGGYYLGIPPYLFVLHQSLTGGFNRQIEAHVSK